MWWRVSIAMLAVFGTPANGEVVVIGGLRKVQADVRSVESDYVVAVRFLPVRSFDKATNKRLNVGKGRKYALLALARHLESGPSVQLSVSSLHVEDKGEQDHLYCVQVSIPRKNVKMRRGSPQRESGPPNRPVTRNEKGRTKETPSATIEVRFSRNSPLLARKQDYLDTIAELFVASNDELSIIKSNQAEDRFLNAIVEVEENIVGHLKVLSKQIAEDRFLLSNERGELRNEMNERQGTLFASLRTLVKSKGQSEKRKEGGT
jgi:hypothetical protein